MERTVSLGESIEIREGITLMVTEIRGDRVVFGITAAEEITIHREEVQQAIERAKQSENNSENC